MHEQVTAGLRRLNIDADHQVLIAVADRCGEDGDQAVRSMAVISNITGGGSGGGTASAAQAVQDAQKAYDRAMKRLKDMPPPGASTDPEADAQARELASNAVQVAAARLAAAQAALAQAQAAAQERDGQRALQEQPAGARRTGVVVGLRGQVDGYI